MHDIVVESFPWCFYLLHEAEQSAVADQVAQQNALMPAGWAGCPACGLLTGKFPLELGMAERNVAIAFMDIEGFTTIQAGT